MLLAELLGVNVSSVVPQVRSGSVIFDFRVFMSPQPASSLLTPASLSGALGVNITNVISTYTILEIAAPSPPPPSPPPPSPPPSPPPPSPTLFNPGLSVPDAGGGTVLTVLIAVGTGSLLGGIAAILLVRRCRRSRAKSVGRAGNTPDAFGRLRAQVGFGASTSSRTADERGAATHGIALDEDLGAATHGIALDEDVDIVKATQPARQTDAAVRPARDLEAEATIDLKKEKDLEAEATIDLKKGKDLEAEATIDFVKKDKPVAPAFASATFDEHNPSKNNLLSSIPSDLTPRWAAKSFALNQMIIQATQATKSSKIQPIPWKDLKILEKLGEGTFGTVHACSFKATPCAVKQLREDRESSAALLADMLQEHDTMMTLRHPNVVLMLGITTDNVQRVGIVLELLEISLLELLHGTAEYREYRTWRASLLSIASDVAKGVAYLHFNNLLHRDLKPGNVLLSDSWVAKVADFGSSAKGKPGSAAEGEGIHGTPPYMAPEVARGEAHSAALDVWSFGCLLVHMTTLRPPYYALKCKTAMDIVRVVQRGEVSPVQVLIDDTDRREYKCPASILALAKQCCRRDPEQRPDMPAIADAIASPGIQNGILKGARDMRPLVRLQRRRVLAPVAVDSQGTYDASQGTYGASKSILGGSLALSPRADAAPSPRVSSSSTKSKFRRMSKQTSAAAGFVSTYDGTFDDAASSSTCDANKASTSTFVGNSPTLTRTMDMTDSIDLALTLPRSSKTPFVTTFERPGRMTSLRAGCDSARLSSVPSPRAGGDDVLTSTYEASKYVASSSTFDSSRTFDGNSPTSK
eukprot:jgi/Chrpa1/18799/Chrysochromulina_OHIO_Genome00027641-RA